MSNTAYWNKQYWNKKEDEEINVDLPSQVYEADAYKLSRPVYNFIHNDYTVAYNNTLNNNNIKNDFVVWGAYTSVSEQKFPCRFHLAIDKKPSLNKHTIALYKDSLQNIRAVGVNTKTNTPKEGDQLFPNAVAENAKGVVFKVETRTAVDWREQIYYQMCESEKLGTDTNTEINNSYFQYYPQLKEQFPKIFNLQTQEYIEDVQKHPDRIGYFLDFIDEDSGLGQYSVNNIGRRAKIVSNDKINCVFEPTIPDIVYLNKNDEDYEETRDALIAYKQYWTQIPDNISQLFDTGGTLNSCFEQIKNLLYQYTHLNNTISITTLPIYYLQPNTRITVEDEPAGIYGDYIIQSISVPLDISSTMTINAYRAQQKI